MVRREFQAQPGQRDMPGDGKRQNKGPGAQNECGRVPSLTQAKGCSEQGADVIKRTPFFFSTSLLPTIVHSISLAYFI